MKESFILMLMALGLVLGNFQVESALNVTLPTELAMEHIGKAKFPKLYVNKTSPLKLKCVFTTTAPSMISTVTWHHNDVLLQKGPEYDMRQASEGNQHSNFLIIEKPKPQSLGRYKCQLSLTVGEKKKQSIELIGPPMTILNNGEKAFSRRVSEDSKNSLTCQYRANPTDDIKVEWFRDNYSLPLTLGADMRIEDELDESGKLVAKLNVLTFDSIKASARGFYFCKVSNKFGEDYLGWQIRVKNRYSFLWPLIGIILEVIVVVVIIVVYEIKKNKKRKAKLLAQQNMQFSDEDCQTMPGDCDADSEVRQRLARA